MRKHCSGNIVAETLLRMQMLPCLRVHATFVADANCASEMQKKFLNFFKKHFVSATNVAPFARHGNITINNVSATTFPRFRGPLSRLTFLLKCYFSKLM